MTKKKRKGKAKHRVKRRGYGTVIRGKRHVWGVVDGKKYYTPHTHGRALIAKEHRAKQTPYRDTLARFYHKVRGVTKKKRR